MTDRDKIDAIHAKVADLNNQIEAMESVVRALETEEFYICNPECAKPYDFESNLTNLLL